MIVERIWNQKHDESRDGTRARCIEESRGGAETTPCLDVPMAPLPTNPNCSRVGSLRKNVVSILVSISLMHSVAVAGKKRKKRKKTRGCIVIDVAYEKLRTRIDHLCSSLDLKEILNHVRLSFEIVGRMIYKNWRVWNSYSKRIRVNLISKNLSMK